MTRRLADRAFHRQGLTFNRRSHLRSSTKIQSFHQEQSGEKYPQVATGKLKKSRKFAGKSRDKRKGKTRQPTG